MTSLRSQRSSRAIARARIAKVIVAKATVAKANALDKCPCRSNREWKHAGARRKRRMRTPMNDSILDDKTLLL